MDANDAVGEVFAVSGGVVREITQWRQLKIRSVRAGRGSACLVGEGQIVSLTSADDAFEAAVDVSYGEAHALGLDAQGRVWVREHGWAPLERQWRAVSVACGAKHSAAATTQGDVYTWGRGFEGQLGHGRISVVPKLVSALSARTRVPHDKVRRVACGHNFTMALTESGVLWAWGEGRCGELGVGRRVTSLSAPTRVDWNRACQDVACGWAHVLAVSDGDLYSWGLNRNGQLGLGSVVVSNAPAPAPASFVLDEAVPPAPFSPSSVLSPCALGLKKVTAVAASGSASAAVAQNGTVFAWGRRNDGSSSCDPTTVDSLSDKRATHVALCDGTLFVFAPSCLREAQPALIPMAGTRVLARGVGLFPDESGSIMVRVTGTRLKKKKASTVTQTVMGDYVAPSSVLVQLSPRDWNMTGERLTVEVSLNSKDYIASTLEIGVYADPVLDSIEPACCDTTGAQRIEIHGANLLDGASVRFSNSEQTWIVKASLVDDMLVCTPPSIQRAPQSFQVAAALNGRDFVPVPNQLFVIHDAKLSRLLPDCAPVSTQSDISICGSSFFASADIAVRLVVGDIETVVQGRYVDENAIEFTLPTFELNADDRVIACAVSASLDGGVRFLDGTLRLTLYRDLDPAEILAATKSAGPAAGGSRCTLVLPEDYVISSSSLVRVVSVATDVYEPVEATAPLADGFVFTAPAVELRRLPVEDDEEAAQQEEQVPPLLDVVVEIALDGRHFSQRSLEPVFAYFPTPSITAADSTEDRVLTIAGDNFRDGPCTVKVGDACLDATCADSNIIVTVPDDNEGPVAVSFNGGLDFTKTADMNFPTLEG